MAYTVTIHTINFTNPWTARYIANCLIANNKVQSVDVVNNKDGEVIYLYDKADGIIIDDVKNNPKVL